MRVEAKRMCEARRDVRTVWILERNFEERIVRRMAGRRTRGHARCVVEIQDNQRRVVKEAMAEEARRLDLP